jgi:internalin A
MLKNNLRLEENEIKAILALEAKDIDATIAESSNVLYGFLHSGISDKYEMRLIILGEKGHGKTAFRSRFVKLNGYFPDKEATTEGVDFEDYKIPDSEKDVTIKFWDFAGDTVTHEAHKYFLSERAVYVIVYGSRKEEEGQLSKWLEHIKDFAEISKGKKPKIFILVNLLRNETTKKDVKVSINENQLKQNYKNDFDLEFDYMNLLHDNEEGGKIADYRRKIEDYILSLDTKVPAEYVEIYERIQDEENNNFIDVCKVRQIVKEVTGNYSPEILT